MGESRANRVGAAAAAPGSLDPFPSLHTQVAPLMDKRVEINGTSRADMNGKRGVATDFHFNPDQGKARYTVQLDSGEAFKFKDTSVRAEEADGAKGKRKGKKGRAGRK